MKPMTKHGSVALVMVALRSALWSACVTVCVGLAACGGPTAQAAPSTATGEPGSTGVPAGGSPDAAPTVVAEAPPPDKEKAPDAKKEPPADPKPAPGKDDAAKDAAPSGDLVHTVATTKSRADMSASLVKPAAAAAEKREFGKAIRYYNALVVARGPGSPEAQKLAEMWALAGQPQEAIEVLRRFVAASSDEAAVKQATKDITNLGKIQVRADRFQLPSLDKEGTKLFKLGRAAHKKKKWGDALVYFHMGLALAPDLPGFLRELGGTYDKLGAKDKKLEFYLGYLRSRPFGKNADEIRKQVPKTSLGSLTVTSSKDCELVLINAQPLTKKLPAKDLKLAAGEYKGMCISSKYEIIVFERVTVQAGGTHSLDFRWAIIVNELKDPMGRLSVESAYDKGTMMDLGITSPELGVVVPDDGRALKVILKDDSGTRTEERYIKFTPGEKQTIKW